jgi:hypothetical protein
MKAGVGVAVGALALTATSLIAAAPASARQAWVFCDAGARGGWGGDGGWSQGGNGGIAFSIGGGNANASGGNAGSARGGIGGRGGGGFLPVCNQSTNDWWGDDSWDDGGWFW